MKAFIAIVLFFVAVFVSSQDLPAQPFPVKWKAVAGAGGYLAEVKDSQENIVATRQVGEETTVTLQLVPGPYTLRVTTLNRFLKPESDTGWLSFHVDAPAPVVGDSSAVVLHPGDAATLTLPVSGLAQDAAAALKSPSGRLVPIDLPAPVVGSVSLVLPALTEKGAWSVVLTNPPSQSTTVVGRLSVLDPDFMFIYPTIWGPGIDFRDKSYGTGFGVDQVVATDLRKTELTKLLLDSYGTKQFWANVIFYPGLGLMYCGIGFPVMLIANTISGSAYEDLSRAVASYNGPADGKVTFDLKQFGYKLSWNNKGYDPHDPAILDVLSADPRARTLVEDYRATSGTATVLGWTGVLLPVAGAFIGYNASGLEGFGLAVLFGSAGLASLVGSSFVGASAEAELVQAVRTYNETH